MKFSEIINDRDLLIKANSMNESIEIIDTGIFGVNHYKVGKYEFERKKRFYWQDFSPIDWHMTVNGKSCIIHYKYVLALTYKSLGLI